MSEKSVFKRPGPTSKVVLSGDLVSSTPPQGSSSGTYSLSRLREFPVLRGVSWFGRCESVGLPGTVGVNNSVEFPVVLVGISALLLLLIDSFVSREESSSMVTSSLTLLLSLAMGRLVISGIVLLMVDGVGMMDDKDESMWSPRAIFLAMARPFRSVEASKVTVEPVGALGMVEVFG